MQPQPRSVVANGHHHNAASRAADRLRNQICSNHELAFLMEAHDGLSGAIAQRAGFKGLWASGLSISCSLGYRDANEASWTQLVDVVERMTDSTDLPVLVDGDSGFGNFNNARLLARKLRQRGAAGVALGGQGLSQDEFVHRRSASACRYRRVLRPAARCEGYSG